MRPTEIYRVLPTYCNMGLTTVALFAPGSGITSIGFPRMSSFSKNYGLGGTKGCNITPRTSIGNISPINGDIQPFLRSVYAEIDESDRNEVPMDVRGVVLQCLTGVMPHSGSSLTPTLASASFSSSSNACVWRIEFRKRSLCREEHYRMANFIWKFPDFLSFRTHVWLHDIYDKISFRISRSFNPCGLVN